MPFSEASLLSLSVALGTGLLIGVERERRKGSGPQRAIAGVRTFALASLAGWLAQMLAQPWLVAAGALLIVVLTAINYWRSTTDDPGTTTELALFVTYLLGVTANDQPTLTGGAGVVVASLLAARGRIHEFSTEILTDAELQDALLFGAAALIVLPLLPGSIPLFPDLNLRKLWSLVVLFMALQAAGYVALRLFGASLGLALSGLASGFASSTATIAALGARARSEPTLLTACVSGALFSTVSTVLLLGIVALAVHPPAMVSIAPSIGIAGIVIVAVALLSLRHAPKAMATEKPSGRAFNLIHAFGFAAILSIVTALVSLANERFGQGAVGFGTALSGFFDAHAASASAFSLAAAGKMSTKDVVLPMLLAFTTNTFSKIAAAWVSGGRSFALRVGCGLACSLLAAWAPFIWL